jgi:hypothetical protein
LREVASRAEQFRIAHRGRNRAGAHDPDARNAREQFAKPGAATPSGQLRLNLLDFSLGIVQLGHDQPQNRPCELRQSRAFRFDRRDQLFDVAQSLRRDAELSQMRAQRVDQHGALTNLQIARAMHHEHRLLIGVFHRHEAHGGARHRLADRFGVSRRHSCCADVRLHISRRHQLYFMPFSSATPVQVWVY